MGNGLAIFVDFIFHYFIFLFNLFLILFDLLYAMAQLFIFVFNAPVDVYVLFHVVDTELIQNMFLFCFIFDYFFLNFNVFLMVLNHLLCQLLIGLVAVFQFFFEILIFLL